MIVLGLTGSIGMGKSTTADFFSTEGVPVHDSDATVHMLYRGAAVPLLAAAFPGIVEDGEINRARLSRMVVGDPEALNRLEKIVHPLVRAETDKFIEENRKKKTPLIVLDIPLLFETGGSDRVDKIVVVSAPENMQRDRVLARPGMTEQKFEAILARQVPDAEKRKRADYVIDTGKGLEHAHMQVKSLIKELTSPGH